MEPDASVTRFDPADVPSALDAVFDAVSEFKRSDTNELRRLDRYVAPDAINLLFGDPGNSTARIEEGSLSFRYDDVFVTLTHDGWIEVVDADAFYMRPAPRGLSTNARERRSPDAALKAASAALAEAEEHVWTAASNTPNDELGDPLWATVERLWALQTSLGDAMARSGTTEPSVTRTDEQR